MKFLKTDTKEIVLIVSSLSKVTLKTSAAAWQSLFQVKRLNRCLQIRRMNIDDDGYYFFEYICCFPRSVDRSLLDTIKGIFVDSCPASLRDANYSYNQSEVSVWL